MLPRPTETRAAARRRLAADLAAAGIVGADLDARVLLCAAAGIDHAELVRDPDIELGGDVSDRLAGFAARRVAGEPVSRILGRREFWGLTFQISPDVLDPRPETEGLVASVLDAVGGRRAAPLSILDLGTGSGAILAALLRELPGSRGIGIDRSAAACRIAANNLAAVGVADRAGVLCGSWADSVRGRFDIVVSNPPYVRRDAVAGLEREVRAHDPRAALDGGPDGFDAYRSIVPSLPRLLHPGGTAGFECGTGQGATVAGLLREAGLRETAVYSDLAGHDRIVLGFAAEQ